MSTRSGGGGGRKPPGGPGKQPFGSHSHYKEAQAQKDQAAEEGDEGKELAAIKTERKSRAVHGNTQHGGLDTGHQKWNAHLNRRIRQLEASQEEQRDLARGPVGADGGRPTPKTSAPLAPTWGSGRIPGTAPKAPSLGLDAFPSLVAPTSTSSSSSTTSHTTPGPMPPVASPSPSTSTPMAPIPTPRPTSVHGGSGTTTSSPSGGLVPTGSTFSPPVQSSGPSRPTVQTMPPVSSPPKRGGGEPGSSTTPGSGGKPGGGTGSGTGK